MYLKCLYHNHVCPRYYDVWDLPGIIIYHYTNGFRSGPSGREVWVQALWQSVSMEAELEKTHSGGPLWQGSATRVSPLRDELQAHKSSEQTRHTMSAYRIRRQSVVLGVHVCGHVHRSTHTQTAAAVSGRLTHYRRHHIHHRDVVAVPDDIGVALEKPEFGPKLEF